jgi:hypothetical protein
MTDLGFLPANMVLIYKSIMITLNKYFQFDSHGVWLSDAWFFRAQG